MYANEHSLYLTGMASIGASILTHRYLKLSMLPTRCMEYSWAKLDVLLGASTSSMSVSSPTEIESRSFTNEMLEFRREEFTASRWHT